MAMRRVCLQQVGQRFPVPSKASRGLAALLPPKFREPLGPGEHTWGTAQAGRAGCCLLQVALVQVGLLIWGFCWFV